MHHELANKLWSATQHGTEDGVNSILSDWLTEKCNSFLSPGRVISEERLREHFGLSKKEWCQHINGRCISHGDYKHEIAVMSCWQFCPICGKERPNCGSRLGEV